MDRCTCKITPGTSAYGGNQIDSRGCEKHDTRDEIIEQLRQERDNALRYTELLIAERDTAQAGEARAVEACQMINEQKADRLEEMAFDAGYRDQESDAALLRECAAMMREREVSEVQWDTEGGAAKNGLYLWAGPVLNGFVCLVFKQQKRLYLDWHPTLEAARSAAVAWVNEQEGQ